MCPSPDEHAMLRRAAEFQRDGAGYRLVDFGEGRKLERFAGRLVERPSPAAESARRRDPSKWQADSIFDSRNKRWQHRVPWPDDLAIDCAGFRMPTAPTPYGHVGVFPEQRSNWKWLIDTAPANAGSPVDPPDALNLFAYTGASSVAMASTGMRVAHVDAAKPNVAAAKAAATLNGLSDHPIRYLVDDAAKFAARERRRENSYHTIVMDPPAYGHSPSGKAWRLERDLWPLLDTCLALLDRKDCRLLVTGHSPQVGPADVLDYLRKQLPAALGIRAALVSKNLLSGRLSLPDEGGRKLDAGFYVRFAMQVPTP